MNETHDSPDGIAIVGMACRFPGASSPEQFWENLSAGREEVTWFSDAQLRAAGVAPALLQNPQYVKAAIALDAIESFDAGLFGMNRREAEILDPQQRILMECAYAALEDAGYDPATYPGMIGVYAGVGANTYVHGLLARSDIRAAVGGYQIALANEKDFLATRIAYKLNLKGPSLTVQTACSTSLVAAHLACQSLLNFESDMMLVGGCSIDAGQDRGYLYQEGGIISPEGHCRAFDAAAQGTMAGRGGGMVVLRRLADALADGDTIYAVIKGSAVNNDGALKVGFTAPSQDGQAAVIKEAQALAGVAPESITYVETHGTGTALGDPIEFAALSAAFGATTTRRQFCALGAVKPNIGHLDTAAGVAGLIKTALALKHRQIPPLINFSQPNPKIDLAASPFYVTTKLIAWPAADGPRRAGVSSFGIGGTNAHLILEEAPPPPAARDDTYPARLLVLSAKTRAALDEASARLGAHLAHTEQPLADIAATLQTGRKAYRERRALAAGDRAAAAAALASGDSKQGVSGTADPVAPPLVWMFPGQGAQSVGMGRQLYDHEPVFRAALDECAALLQPHLGLDLRDVLYPAPEAAEAAAARLGQTALTQPALFAVEYALAQLWLSWGLKPAAMVGHSIGEYAAACLAGVFALADALALVAARGRLMQSLPPGAMAAVPLTEEELAPHLTEELAIAAVNGPRLCTVSGPAEAVAALTQRLAALGTECRPLHTSHAFHSPMMEPILDEWTRLVASVRLTAPRLPYLSNLTGDWITAEQATSPTYWARHLREAVRWNTGLETLFAEPSRVYLEVGPGQTLATLVRRHPGAPDRQRVASSLARPGDAGQDLRLLLSALGQLWVAGATVTWAAVAGADTRRRVPLPTYPFARDRYWIDPPAAPVVSSESAHDHPSSQGETTMSEAPAQAAASARHQRILAELGKLMHGLTGATLDEIGADSTFFEVGLDSLLLIQFNQAIQDSFGVKISLVQLLEQYTTLNSIAGYLDQQLPADRFSEPAPAAAQPGTPSPAAPAGYAAASYAPPPAQAVAPAPIAPQAS
ncbi:MAG TPA: beta-ketoacyl synthase N-terminal-like domain-containing protein, partial [Herpetosiphonaceae bacterium]